MKYWITGAKGLVGSYLTKTLKFPFVGTGRELDIADREQVYAFLEREGPFTHIINCAAMASVDEAELKQAEAFRVNCEGVEVLGEAAKDRQIRLLHLSTDYVFDGKGKVPLKEEDPTEPCNYYGVSKLEGEKRLGVACPDATILRTSWIYGSGGKNFVAKLIGLLKTEEEIRLVEDQISRPTFVPDLVEVMLKIIPYSGLYQFANAGATSKYQLALAFRQKAIEMGMEIKCRSILPAKSNEFSSPAKRPLFSPFDTTKIESLLHIKPRHWQDTLEEYLASYASK